MKIPDEQSIGLPGTVRRCNGSSGFRARGAFRGIHARPPPYNATSARFCARTGVFTPAWSLETFSIAPVSAALWPT